LIGQTLSHFRITAKLGEGGMGEVLAGQPLPLKYFQKAQSRIAMSPIDLGTGIVETTVIQAVTPRVLTVKPIAMARITRGMRCQKLTSIPLLGAA
jgi:hypothetical protein